MTKPENPSKLFPMFVTAKLAETKAFYVDKLGWKVTYDMPYYLQVRLDGADGPELAFMSVDSQGAGGGPSFAGQGVVVSVPVADADRHCAEVRERGATPTTEPSLKPWGWRSYHVADPNGVILDFFHVEAQPVAPQS